MTPFLAASLVALAALMGGCGDDGEDESKTTSAVTVPGEAGDTTRAMPKEPEGKVPVEAGAKAEFIVAAREVCANARARVREQASALAKLEVDPGSKDTVYEQFFTTVVAPELEAEIEGIRALNAPAGDASEVEAILGALEDALAEVSRDPASVALEDGLFARSEVRAKKYGLRGCGGI
jgi:hypothetical protein